MTDVKEFALRDRLGPLVVKGELIADSRFGSETRPRWTDMALYRVADPGGVPRSKQFLHDIAADTMNNTQRAALAGVMPRLVNLLYDTQPIYHYVIEIVARSYVYHRFPGGCVKPRHHISTVAEIRESNHRWRNLFQCEKCRPPELEHMQTHQKVAEEKPESQVYLCTTASDIISRLQRRNGEISLLAARMLRKAAVHDPDIAAAIEAERRV